MTGGLTEALVNNYGTLGVLLALLGQWVYSIYEQRVGRMAEIADRVEEAHSRLDGVAVILFRQADEEWDDVDEQHIRDMLFNGEEVTFPQDIEASGGSAEVADPSDTDPTQ